MTSACFRPKSSSTFRPITFIAFSFCYPTISCHASPMFPIWEHCIASSGSLQHLFLASPEEKFYSGGLPFPFEPFPVSGYDADKVHTTDRLRLFFNQPRSCC